MYGLKVLQETENIWSEAIVFRLVELLTQRPVNEHEKSMRTPNSTMAQIDG